MKISVGDIRLFVEISGPPLPPLFLMHGGPGANHLRLKRDLAYLGQWFQLVLIDERGCGQSDKSPKSTLTVAQNVADMEAVRAAFGFEKISVLGWSYGGMLAAAYAAKYAHRLDLLFLLSTAGSGDFLRSSAAWLTRNGTPEQQREGLRSLRCEPVPPAQLKQHVAILNRLNQRRVMPALPVTWNMAALRIGIRKDLPRWDVLPQLHRVKVPTFIAVGRQDWICPVDQSLALKRALPHADLHIYERAAHYPATDAPQRFRRDIVKFIKRHES